jgi:hypothetical protein
MDSLSAPDQSPIVSFSDRRGGKARIPRERNDNAAPVRKIYGQAVRGHADFLSNDGPGFNRRSTHASVSEGLARVLGPAEEYEQVRRGKSCRRRAREPGRATPLPDCRRAPRGRAAAPSDRRRRRNSGRARRGGQWARRPLYGDESTGSPSKRRAPVPIVAVTHVRAVHGSRVGPAMAEAHDLGRLTDDAPNGAHDQAQIPNCAKGASVERRLAVALSRLLASAPLLSRAFT